MMPRDAHDHRGDEHQGRDECGSAWLGREQDGPQHDGDRERQQHLQDLALVLDRHEGEEDAGHDEAGGIQRPGDQGQALPHEARAAGAVEAALEEGHGAVYR